MSIQYQKNIDEIDYHFTAKELDKFKNVYNSHKLEYYISCNERYHYLKCNACGGVFLAEDNVQMLYFVNIHDGHMDVYKLNCPETIIKNILE